MISETRKLEITTIIDEIIIAERNLRDKGMEVSDQDEWQQIGDIVSRILAKIDPPPSPEQK
jgi:hypothetical protein